MRRLNPFAFPPETNTRFVLIMIAVLMITVNTAGFINIAVFDPEDSVQADPNLPPEEFFAAQAASSMRLAFEAVQASCVLILALGLVFGAAYWHYRKHPERIRKRQKLERVDPKKDKLFQQAISTLAEHTGLPNPPQIEVAQGSQGTDGQAFGLPGKYSVRLGGRMPLLLRKSPKLFGATVLHELAHIVNGDVGRTYFTQSLTLATLVLVLVPMILFFTTNVIGAFGRRVVDLVRGVPVDWSGFIFGAIPTWIILMGQVALMAGLVVVIRSGLLRVRELLADWRASLWGAEKDLTQILERNRTTEDVPAWRRILKLHPTAEERLATLRDSSKLFRLNPDIPLIAGVLMAITIAGLLELIVFIGTGLLSPIFSLAGTSAEVAAETDLELFLTISQVLAVILGILLPLVFIVPALIVAYFVVESVGLQVKREALADLVQHGRERLSAYLRLAVPALLFSIGFQIGLYLPPVAFFAPLQILVTSENAIRVIFLPFTTLAWVIVITVLIWLWLCCTRFASLNWLGRHIGAKEPIGKQRILTFCLTVLLGSIIMPGLLLQSMLFEQLTGDQVLSDFTGLTAGFFAFAVVLLIGFFVGVAGLIIINGAFKRKCPRCGQQTGQKFAAGHACEHCGAELAAWLLVPE